MGELAYTVWIAAAPAEVWRVYVDPTRIPDWQTGHPVVAEVAGAPGEPGSTYVARRGPLTGRTAVVTSDPPHELVTVTDAPFGLQFETTSHLTGREGGTVLRLHVTTRWRRRLGPLARVVEAAILNEGQARTELANLRDLLELDASA